MLNLHLKGFESANDERLRILDIITNSKDQLVSIGYADVAIETFYDMFIDLIENLFNTTNEELLLSFQESGNSDYYTWFMRLLTAGAIRGQPDRFLPFLSDDVNFNAVAMDGNIDKAILTYCQYEVEPMGKECEQVHITALAEYLGVVLHIEYLDGR